jgi:hypothetical protein
VELKPLWLRAAVATARQAASMSAKENCQRLKAMDTLV